MYVSNIASLQWNILILESIHCLPEIPIVLAIVYFICHP